MSYAVHVKNALQKHWQGQLTQDWLTVFDLKYINDVMIGGLRRASGAIEEYCERLAVKAFSLSKVLHEVINSSTGSALLL